MNITKAKGKSYIKSDGKNAKRRRRVRPNVAKRIPYAKIGSQVWNDFNWLRQFVNTEIHYNDVTNSTNISSTSTLVLMNGLTQGDTAITRTGQSIRMNTLDINAYIIGNSTAGQQSVRILLVFDKQPNASAYTSTSLLNSDNTISPYAVGGQNRFIVYMDEMYALSTAGPLNAQFSKRIQLNQHTEYNTGNAGTIADINSGSLYLQFVSDQATNVPILAYYCRLWFVDN
jgi:hypothetical protein